MKPEINTFYRLAIHWLIIKYIKLDELKLKPIASPIVVNKITLNDRKKIVNLHAKQLSRVCFSLNLKNANFKA